LFRIFNQKMKRKQFIKTLGLSSLALSTKAHFESLPAFQGLKIGLASYTLRKYSVDQVIEIMKRLAIKDVCLKSFHLPYDASPQELKATAEKFKSNGLNVYAGGVIYMKTNEEVEKYFKYAQNAGLKMIVGAPEHHLLPKVEEMVKATDVKIAIHNHGPEDKIFPSPASVYEKIKNLDARIGLCIDTGHTFRLNQDPAAEFRKFRDRLFDIHLKDLNSQKPEAENVEIGRGVMNISLYLQVLKELKYEGIIGVEYEKDADNAAYGLTESVGYLRGILRMS
jgi:inosose dehydratase